MKINDPNLNGLASPGVGKPQEQDASARSRSKGLESGSASGEDHVQLSTLGSQLRAEDSESPERAAYLEKLQAQVEDGSYQADVDQLSKRIIDEATKAGEK
ncbi:MAG TPA: flagellar biosynthesis anti-sigma factor FlgM [Bryobacteraceae bacterium]|nr:flagellar biosynthesis anti-sigma factor FlgM [Bryobacteraceae bacterium]